MLMSLYSSLNTKPFLAVLFLAAAGCTFTQGRRVSAPPTAIVPVRHTRPTFVNPEGGYLVARIDSLDSVYLIYARRSDTLFKIVSDKTRAANCTKLRPGGRYPLRLRSLYFTDATKEELAQYPVPMATVGHLHSGGIDWDGKGLLIKMEGDSIRDLHYAQNLSGLCLQ